MTAVNRERSICVVLHDVAPPTWRATETLLARLAETGVFRVTLLAVPRYHGSPRDAGFERWLVSRAARGDEVALHGYTHLDEGRPRGPIDRLRRTVYTRGEGEFSDLDFDSATRRLREGMAWLNELDLQPAGFVAPAWLLGSEAWRALRLQPFLYTCTLRRIVPLAHPGSLVCQAQVYSTSTSLRRGLSVLWNESLAWWQRNQDTVRLELHPTDAVGSVARSWERLARRGAATRQVLTLGDIAARLSP